MDPVVVLHLSVLGVISGAILLTQRHAIIRAFHRRRLRRAGVDGVAQVLAVTDTGSRLNGQPVANLSLSVTPAGAPAFQAVSQVVVTPINAPLYSPGRILHVRFDPARSGEVAVIGPAH